jgi:hypothetical protein
MLHEETVRLVQELFFGKICNRCRQPAYRIRKDKYYCSFCFTGRQNAEVRVHKANHLQYPRTVSSPT